jgi:phosphocarrier protein HPr
MISCEVAIRNRLGLHARAAAQLVRAANGFKSNLKLERMDGSATADAKSILSVLMLAASFGTALRVTAEGEDQEQALQTIKELIDSGFGEEIEQNTTRT